MEEAAYSAARFTNAGSFTPHPARSKSGWVLFEGTPLFGGRFQRVALNQYMTPEWLISHLFEDKHLNAQFSEIFSDIKYSPALTAAFLDLTGAVW